MHAAEPHLFTATLYLSLFTADLAQPKRTFLGSKGFYSTLGANFLKGEHKRKKDEKSGVSKAIQPSDERRERRTSPQFWFALLKSLNMTQFSESS